jgi:hypothetical protein
MDELSLLLSGLDEEDAVEEIVQHTRDGVLPSCSSPAGIARIDRISEP